jgi:hypothetical protein
MTTSFHNPYLPLSLIASNTQLFLAVGTYKRSSFFLRTSREALWCCCWWGIGSRGRWCFAYSWAKIEAYSIEIQYRRHESAHSNVRRTASGGTVRRSDRFVEAVCCPVDLGMETIDLRSKMCEATIQRAEKIHDIVQLFVPLPSPCLCLW